MQPLSFEDIVNIAEYEIERPIYRAQIIEFKKTRRIQIGELVTLVFENRDTIRFQIQEMMRAERIVLDDRIQEEIDIYNQLLPKRHSLSATLLIEVTDQTQMRKILDSFIGIDREETTLLNIGNEVIAAEYEGGRSKEDRISAVHYITFTFTGKQVTKFVSGDEPISLEIDHLNYKEKSPISEMMRRSLANDLR